MRVRNPQPPRVSVFSAPTRRPLTIGTGVPGYADDTTAPTPPPPVPSIVAGVPAAISALLAPPPPAAAAMPAAAPHPNSRTGQAPSSDPPPEAGPFFGQVKAQDYWVSDDIDDQQNQDLSQEDWPAADDLAPQTGWPRRLRRPARVEPTGFFGGFLSGVRRRLGSGRTTAVGRATRQTAGDPAWLVDQEQDPVGTAAAELPDGPKADPPHTDTRRDHGPATPVRAALLRRGLIDPNTDLEVVKAPREWSATARRVAVAVVLALFMVAGTKQVLWNPLFGTKTVTTSVAGLDQDDADAAAIRYALDYFSYSPAAATTGQAAFATDVVGGDTTAARWTGTGYLRADSAVPGAMHLIDPAHAVIDVTVRISLGMPPAPKPGAAPVTPAPTAAVPAASAADPGPLPPGWIGLGSRWVTVAVPIDTSSGAAKVAASGLVFTGETPGQVTAPGGSVGDTATSAATQGVATSFFAAYARSDIAYLVAPEVNLAGLSGAVTLVSLANWTAVVPAGSNAGGGTPSTSVGTGAVTWQLAGTDLQITQQYAMALTGSQNRWYAAALSPLPPVSAQ